MITDPQRDEQSTERRREMVETYSGDGERRNADQAETAQQASGNDGKRLVQGDPGQPCGGETTLQDLLIELQREQLGSSIIERAFYPAPLSVPPREREAEWVAWSMLAWASPAGIAAFDEELASEGFYSKVFREHSDRGLAEIEAKEKPPSSELAAFKRLEEMGVYDQTVFYSPAKAQQSHYTNELDRLTGFQSAKREIAPDGRRTLSARELLDQAGRGATGNGSSETRSCEPEGFGSSARATRGSQGICDPHAW